MNRAILNGFVVLLVALLATGCSNLNKKSTGSATVENRGISSGEMSDIDAARSSGVADGAGVGGAELNDPNSPLAVRVIYFDYDSSNIREDFQSVVEAHAAYLAAHPETTITLEGHADERGSREYNLALGERRALALRRQLVLLGATAGQIRTVSYGEERPVAEGHDEQSYSLNRRAEIIYQ
ncbi:MAG TPA: peptidoglycan-associated lipoprotein Pal [Gammaproteobacteria bacterium]|nr:peptidoglycan-associated lipoprotein Pal [Gammaproteobacteria bacterium]